MLLITRLKVKVSFLINYCSTKLYFPKCADDKRCNDWNNLLGHPIMHKISSKAQSTALSFNPFYIIHFSDE
jgi:hypothetical protein